LFYSLLGIVEDDAKRMAVSRAQATDTVPKIDAIGSPLTRHRAVMDGKGHSITLAQRNNFRSGLHARALFRKYKLATRKISRRLREQDCHLDREDVLAVNVLVEAVIVSFPILQEQRGWPKLFRIMASPKEISVPLGIVYVHAHRQVPTVGDGRKPGIDGSPKFRNDIGQRIAEVFVLAAPEPMTSHDDTASKKIIIRVQSGEGFTLVTREDPFEHRSPPMVKVFRDALPVECVDARDRILG
jgi:hypothetical protein